MIEEPLEDVERPPAAVGIVEAGSTITKSYIASESGVASRALVGINFKENYRKTRHFSDDDLELLAGCARELLTEVSTVRVYGTSIFRDVEQGELVPISERLARLGDVTFEVVTSSQEALLTAEGAIDRLDFDGDIAVMVGGGGSTEVAVFRHGSLMGLANTSMGVGDVNAHFPDLTDDLASSRTHILLTPRSAICSPWRTSGAATRPCSTNSGCRASRISRLMRRSGGMGHVRCAVWSVQSRGS